MQSIRVLCMWWRTTLTLYKAEPVKDEKLIDTFRKSVRIYSQPSYAHFPSFTAIGLEHSKYAGK